MKTEEREREILCEAEKRREERRERGGGGIQKREEEKKGVGKKRAMAEGRKKWYVQI